MSIGVPVTLNEKELDDGSDSDVIFIKRTGSAVLYGDTDENGEVNVTDALLALQGSVGKISLSDSQVTAADVDGDGKITVTDALCLFSRRPWQKSTPSP